MPKLMTWLKNNFTGDLYDYVVSGGPTPDSPTREYTFLKTIRFSATSDNMGRMLVYFPEDLDDLRPLMEIRNLRDADGREVKEGGRWLMTEFEPVLNLFDKVHAYRSRLSLNVTGDTP